MCPVRHLTGPSRGTGKLGDGLGFISPAACRAHTRRHHPRATAPAMHARQLHAMHTQRLPAANARPTASPTSQHGRVHAHPPVMPAQSTASSASRRLAAHTRQLHAMHTHRLPAAPAHPQPAAHTHPWPAAHAHRLAAAHADPTAPPASRHLRRAHTPDGITSEPTHVRQRTSHFAYRARASPAPLVRTSFPLRTPPSIPIPA